MLLYVSSGSRASELLGVTPGDINWAKQLIYVVSKGTGDRGGSGEPAGTYDPHRLSRSDRPTRRPSHERIMIKMQRTAPSAPRPSGSLAPG